MSRQKRGGPPAAESYRTQLLEAISRFLPHQGLPLLSGDDRVRWTSRMLAMVAMLMAWSSSATLLDRFAEARETVVEMYPTRRRPGGTVEGLFKALVGQGVAVLAVLCEYWRHCVRRVAGKHWTVEGWAVFGVDGSKFDCPRTEANEKGLGVSGKNNSGPQQLLTCLFHVASGMLWGWVRGGVTGDGERSQLRKMLDLLPADAMLLADAGFSGYDLLKGLMDRGNCFLIRVGANVKLIRKLGYYAREGKQTVYLWPLDKQGASGHKHALPKSLKRVKPPLVLRLIELKDAKGRPVCLLSNVLQSSKLSDRSAERIYRLRWGIEVMWRDLKRTMGHHKLRSRTPDRAGVELDWAMAGLWLLQLISGERMIQSRQCPRSTSTAGTLRVLRRALSGRRRRRRNLSMELGLAAKDPYQRRSSKCARHYPKKRPQRPPGAPEARMASAMEKSLIQRLIEQSPPITSTA